MEEDDTSEEGSAFPVENGEDMSDGEFHKILRQKVADSVSPN